MTLKHFNQEGSIYQLKTQYGSAITLMVGLLLFALGFYYIDVYPLMWAVLVIAVLAFFSILSKKLYVDMSSKTLYAKVGLVKKPVTIPLDAIQHFELQTVSTNFIKTNAMLNVYYIDAKGKDKVIQAAQGFTVKGMQSILNEMEEIIANGK